MICDRENKHQCVLHPYQCFTPLSMFYTPINVLHPYQCFTPLSMFYTPINASMITASRIQAVNIESAVGRFEALPAAGTN